MNKEPIWTNLRSLLSWWKNDFVTSLKWSSAFCTFRGTLLQKWTHMLRTDVPETVVKWQEEMKAHQKLYGIKGCFMSLSERKVRHKTVILWSEVKEVWNICIQIIWSKDNAKNIPIYIIIWFRHRHNSACNSVNATRLTT